MSEGRVTELAEAQKRTEEEVAALTVTPDAEDEAQTQGVTVLLDGRVPNWEAALESIQD